MSKKMFDRYDTVVFFDTETTGLDAKKCQIIELAMLIARKDGTIEEYDNFVRLPEGEHVPEEIIEITGITDAMLVNGISLDAAASDFRSVIESGKTLIIAHNCQFDMCFMRETLRRVYGDKESNRLVYSADWLDSLSIYKDRATYPHKLADAISHYGLEDKVANTHRAIDDAKALRAICNAMCKERNDLVRYINIFGYNPKYGVSGQKLRKIRYWPQPYEDGFTPYRRTLPSRMYSYLDLHRTKR